MAQVERLLTWAGWTTRQLLNGLSRTRRDKLDACRGTANGPGAEDGNRSSKSPGNTEGKGLLEPCEGKPSRTVLRGGGGGDAAPLPDTGVLPNGDLYHLRYLVPYMVSNDCVPLPGRLQG